jgi:Undecaprenyl-phosphate glucose phosphotransferase
MGGDVISVNLALISVYQWRLLRNPDLQALVENSLPGTLTNALLILNLLLFGSFVAMGLYTLRRGASRVDEIFKLIVAVSLAMFAGVVINTLLPLPQLGGDDLPLNDSLVLPLAWIAVIVAPAIARVLYRQLLSMLRHRGIDTRRVILVGAREPGRDVLNTIRRNPQLGYQVHGFLSDSTPVGSLIDEVPVLGRTSSLGRVVRTSQADEVIIALSGRSSAEVLDLVALAEDESVDIKLYPDAFQLITNTGISIGDVSGLPLISVRNVALDNPLNRGLKRGLDLVVSVLMLTFASPLMLLIAFLIKIDSPGPTFFVQERVGIGGNPFPMIKFRTMRMNAPQLASWTTKNDPRVTALGAFLRRTSLDELPQFINVLRGEMSVVGPRPEQLHWVEQFRQEIPRYMRRHQQKAGITGWAQINGLRGDSSIAERTRLDLYYVENWSLLFDIKIIIQTAVGIVTGRNNGY